MIGRIALGGASLLAGFVGGVIMLAPAAKVIGLSGIAEQPGVQISGVDGRLLSGVITQVTSGQIQLSDLNWSLQPAALLGGKVAADLGFKLQNSIPARGHVVAAPSGVVTLKDWRTSLGIQELKPLLNLPFIPLDGRASLQLDKARVGANQRPEYVRGSLQLTNVKWTLLRPAAPLGAFRVDIDTNEDGVIVGTVSDDNADIGLAGTITLNPDGSYLADLAISPRAQTPPMIRNTLPTLGRPNPDGSYPVKQQGRIPGW